MRKRTLILNINILVVSDLCSTYFYTAAVLLVSIIVYFISLEVLWLTTRICTKFGMVFVEIRLIMLVFMFYSPFTVSGVDSLILYTHPYALNLTKYHW